MNDIFRFEFDVMNINPHYIINAFGRAVDRDFYRDIISNIYQKVADATTMIRSHGHRNIPPALIENMNQFPIQGRQFIPPGVIRNDQPELIFPVMDIDIDNEEENQISRDLWNDPPSLAEIMNRVRRIWETPSSPSSYFYLLSAIVVIFVSIKARRTPMD